MAGSSQGGREVKQDGQDVYWSVPDKDETYPTCDICGEAITRVVHWRELLKLCDTHHTDVLSAENSGVPSVIAIHLVNSDYRINCLEQIVAQLREDSHDHRNHDDD